MPHFFFFRALSLLAGADAMLPAGYADAADAAMPLSTTTFRHFHFRLHYFASPGHFLCLMPFFHCTLATLPLMMLPAYAAVTIRLATAATPDAAAPAAAILPPH